MNQLTQTEWKSLRPYLIREFGLEITNKIESSFTEGLHSITNTDLNNWSYSMVGFTPGGWYPTESLAQALRVSRLLGYRVVIDSQINTSVVLYLPSGTAMDLWYGKLDKEAIAEQLMRALYEEEHR